MGLWLAGRDTPSVGRDEWSAARRSIVCVKGIGKVDRNTILVFIPEVINYAPAAYG